MKTKLISTTMILCGLLFFSPSSNLAYSSLVCFEEIGNADLPFEVYLEGGYGTAIFLQPGHGGSGLSADAYSIVERATNIQFAPLCGGNFVGVWEFINKFPIPMTGRVFDKKFKPVGDDFLITKSDPFKETLCSVSPLYRGGFVVTWRTWENFDKPKAKPLMKIRGRLFDSAGKPTDVPIDVSSPGFNVGAVVKGLPRGGFVVSWVKFREGIYIRFFDDSGKAKTDEMFVAPDPGPNNGCSGAIDTHPYVTKEGIINVFMTCRSMPLTHDFIINARSYNSDGKTLTENIKGELIKAVQGYGRVIEETVNPRIKNLKKD